MTDTVPVGATKFVEPLTFQDILVAAVQDYFGDEFYTPSNIRFSSTIIGNAEETELEFDVVPASDSKIYIRSEYNPDEEAYPLVLINCVTEEDREISFGQYLGRIETDNTLKKVYGKIKNVDVRFTVVSLYSPLEAGKITTHLRTGISSVIRDSLYNYNVINRDANPIMTAAVLTNDEWRSKIPRFLYTFEVNYRIFWQREEDVDLEYLVDYDGAKYLVTYNHIYTPVGDGTRDAAEKVVSRVQSWNQTDEVWEDVSSDLKDVVWDKFKSDLADGTISPNYVGEYVGSGVLP